MLAEGSMPRLPVSMEAASDRMSPKMLPVTMVSNDFGLRMICMAALSTYLQSMMTLSQEWYRCCAIIVTCGVHCYFHVRVAAQ